MPRNAMPRSEEADRVAGEIVRFCDLEKMSVNQLAKLAGASQSALARFLSGDRKTVTRTAKAVAAYVDSRHKQHRAGKMGAIANPRDGIDAAVSEVWDGAMGTAQLLTAVIRAAGPILRVARAVLANSGKKD